MNRAGKARAAEAEWRAAPQIRYVEPPPRPRLTRFLIGYSLFLAFCVILVTAAIWRM